MKFFVDVYTFESDEVFDQFVVLYFLRFQLVQQSIQNKSQNFAIFYS